MWLLYILYISTVIGIFHITNLCDDNYYIYLFMCKRLRCALYTPPVCLSVSLFAHLSVCPMPARKSRMKSSRKPKLDLKFSISRWTLYSAIATSNNMKLIHWLLISELLLHLVQRGGDRPILAVPNVTARPSTASVPITVLLYNGPLLCGFNVPIKQLTCGPVLRSRSKPKWKGHILLRQTCTAAYEKWEIRSLNFWKCSPY